MQRRRKQTQVNFAPPAIFRSISREALAVNCIRRPLAGDLLQERNHAVIQFPQNWETALW
jgi:hypothetical protein